MNSADETSVQQPSVPRVERSRPIRPLPTDRLSLETQFAILRGYAATSSPEGRAVGNDEVSKTVGMNANSISLCNPFWESVGLIIRDGRKQRPADAVFDYLQAFSWNPDTAASKLQPIISSAWFSNVLVPKLTFRSLSRMDAVAFLADETKASPAYRDNLLLILDYMKHVGMINIENEIVTLAQRPAAPPSTLPTDAPQQPKDKVDVDDPQTQQGTKRFAIHVPDKKDVVIMLPEDIDQEDWEMVLEVIKRYVNRWKKFPTI